VSIGPIVWNAAVLSSYLSPSPLDQCLIPAVCGCPSPPASAILFKRDAPSHPGPNGVPFASKPPPRHIYWPTVAPHTFWVDRATTRKSTGHIPFYMAHGIEPILPFDITLADIAKPLFTDELLAIRTRQLQKREEDLAAIHENFGTAMATIAYILGTIGMIRFFEFFVSLPIFCLFDCNVSGSSSSGHIVRLSQAVIGLIMIVVIQRAIFRVPSNKQPCVHHHRCAPCRLVLVFIHISTDMYFLFFFIFRK
jgi:hypothetical protein